MTDRLILKTLLAEYPATRAIRSGELTSELFEFEFAPHKKANKGFKQMVRGLEYDAGELAIVTYLQARDFGKPLVLLPATVVGRFQHHCIVYNIERGVVAPKDLEGKTVGVRAYTQTTGMWVRGILQNQFNVDVNAIQWLTFEDAHVAEYRNPPNVLIASQGKTLRDMLLDGELAAALLGNEMPDDPRLRTVIPDPETAARQWYAETHAISMNHLIVVREELTQEHPEAVRELFRLLKQSKADAGIDGEIDMLPFGLEALRPGLELAIKYSYQQGLISRVLEVEELFNDVTIGLN